MNPALTAWSSAYQRRTRGAWPLQYGLSSRARVVSLSWALSQWRSGLTD